MGSFKKGYVDDLASLPTLDEKLLLEEIRLRYARDTIYTYIGDIIVAVNPYRPLFIYTHEIAQRYTNVVLKKDHPPHIFAIADKAFQNLRRTGTSQCCVVSGESGAGKTETTKHLIQHIVGQSLNKNSDIQQRIIQMNPLLEAFGNAQTVMNNNSSRFGKYIELRFSPTGEVLGAKVSEYLLEKSRVISQGPGERNFHIFYYMFAGLTPEQLSFNLLDRPESHRILRPRDGGVFNSEPEFRFHQDMWKRLTDTMEIVGFSEDEVQYVLAVLAAILHITDIEFEHDLDTDGVCIKDENMLEMASRLLAISPDEFASALICNVNHLRGEKIVSLKNIEQANDGRDAIAKALFGRLFGWIVRQINYMLRPSGGYQNSLCIGVLDIFGFENFPNNSFEQLCINVANEQLQFYFNQQVFQWELDEYKKEGVKGKDIKFTDNRPLLDMLLDKPLGFFSLMDEESRFPRATDQSLVDKLAKNLTKKSQFQRQKGNPLMFVISHYAGGVLYNAEGFLEKNRDTMSANLLDTMKNSESQMVCELFMAPISDTGSLMVNTNVPQRSRKSLLMCKAPDLSVTKGRSLSKKAGQKVKKMQRQDPYGGYENTIRTVGAHFRSSLIDLMEKLLQAQPQFVRCIKPNMHKQPALFQPDLVAAQLKYTGVVETVRIRRQGFATRLLLAEFVSRYKIIAFPLTAPIEATSSNCNKIMKKAKIKDFEMGKTKVFMKYWHTERLNLIIDNIGWQIVACQRFARGFLARRFYRQVRQLSNQDIAAVRGFCVYISKNMDDRHYELIRNAEHDSQKYQRMLIEKQAKLQRILNPPKEEVQNYYQAPPPTKPKPKDTGIYAATPLLFGSSNPFASRMEQSDENISPRPTAFRTNSSDSQNEANGLVKKKSVEPPESPKESYSRAPPSPMHMGPQEDLIYANAKQIARNNQPNGARQNRGPPFLMEQLDETLQKFPQLDTNMWGKLLYLEKDKVLAKLYLRKNEIIVDNSTMEYDGSVVGLGAFKNPNRDAKTKKILSQIGKGIKIVKDNDGSILVSKLTKNDVVVKGYKDPSRYCVSAEVIENMGRLTDRPMKVFDMNEFKSHIGFEIQQPTIDQDRLYRLSMINLSFIRNTFEDADTPSWISIINLNAIGSLGNERVLREVQGMAHLNLSDADEAQLRRNWCKLDHRHAEDSRDDESVPRHARIETRNSGGSVGETHGFTFNTNQRPFSTGSIESQRPPRSGSPGYSDSLPRATNNNGSIPIANRRDWAKVKSDYRD